MPAAQAAALHLLAAGAQNGVIVGTYERADMPADAHDGFERAVERRRRSRSCVDFRSARGLARIASQAAAKLSARGTGVNLGTRRGGLSDSSFIRQDRSQAAGCRKEADTRFRPIADVRLR